jgi:hypothetical protein
MYICTGSACPAMPVSHTSMAVYDLSNFWVKAGQARARAQGRTLGRPPTEENYKLIKQVAA